MRIIRGKDDKHPRVLIFGPPGVGKSTWACAWPDVLAFDGEDGLDQIGPARVKMGTYDETLSDLREACAGTGDHRTVIVDTLDALERRAIDAVCLKGPKGKPVESLADFGYGDGFLALMGRWREAVSIFESAREKGRSVVLVAHMKVETIEDPAVGKHGAWAPQLDKRVAGLMMQWADAVLYACHETGMVDGRAIQTGKRLLITESRTGIKAKNRWQLPSELPLDYATFAAARAGEKASDVAARILQAAEKIDGETYGKAKAMVAEAGTDVSYLLKIETALKEKVGG